MAVDLAAFDLLTERIIGAAIDVHRHLGPGLLESIYQECLVRELAVRRLSFVTQQSAAIVYTGARLSGSYRLDLVVEDCVVVEIKSVAALAPVHQAQTLTYMRITDCPVGLLINFNVPRLIDGMKRRSTAERRGDSWVKCRVPGPRGHPRRPSHPGRSAVLPERRQRPGMESHDSRGRRTLR